MSRPPPFRMATSRLVCLALLAPFLALALALIAFVGMWFTMVLSTLG